MTYTPSLKTHLEARRFEALLKEQVDPQVCITELVRCRNAQGKPFFAYIRLKPSEYMHYRTKLDRGEAVNPNDYEILEYGWGEDPPAHMSAAMEEKYGIDHDFEKKILTMQQEAKSPEAVNS